MEDAIGVGPTTGTTGTAAASATTATAAAATAAPFPSLASLSRFRLFRLLLKVLLYYAHILSVFVLLIPFLLAGPPPIQSEMVSAGPVDWVAPDPRLLADKGPHSFDLFCVPTAFAADSIAPVQAQNDRRTGGWLPRTRVRASTPEDYRRLFAGPESDGTIQRVFSVPLRPLNTFWSGFWACDFRQDKVLRRVGSGIDAEAENFCSAPAGSFEYFSATFTVDAGSLTPAQSVSMEAVCFSAIDVSMSLVYGLACAIALSTVAKEITKAAAFAIILRRMRRARSTAATASVTAPVMTSVLGTDQPEQGAAQVAALPTPIEFELETARRVCLFSRNLLMLFHLCVHGRRYLILLYRAHYAVRHGSARALLLDFVCTDAPQLVIAYIVAKTGPNDRVFVSFAFSLLFAGWAVFTLTRLAVHSAAERMGCCAKRNKVAQGPTSEAQLIRVAERAPALTALPESTPIELLSTNTVHSDTLEGDIMT